MSNQRYRPDQILPLIAEVEAAAKRAATPHPELNLAERLDIHRGVDAARANRFDILAHAYRDVVSHAQQRWLREQHNIHIVIDRESLDSDEMEYVYEVTYLKPEDEGAKHWVEKLTRVASYGCGPGSYWGAWYTYEEALEEAIKFALTLVQP